MTAMKTLRFAGAILLAWVFAACATPQSRIKKHPAEFDSYPASVQQKIRDGQADVGFTKEQAEMALGRPDRIYSRKTETAAQEIWVYGRRGGSRVGFGLGFGTGGPISMGTGLDLGSRDQSDDRLRLVFQDGKIISVEKSL